MKKVFFIFAILALLADISAAQEWVQTNGPGGGFNQIVFNAKKDMFLSAGTLMRSTDAGKTWAKIAPLDASERTTWTTAIAPNQDVYISGTLIRDSNRIWKSTDNGETWERIWLENVGCVLINPKGSIYILSKQIGNITPIFSLFRSRNSAISWDTLQLPRTFYLGSITTNTNAIDSNGVLVFSGLYRGIIFSTDDGDSWQKDSTKPPEQVDGPGISIACGRGGNIFYTPEGGGSMQSRDNGHTWSYADVCCSGFFSSNAKGRIFFASYDLLYSDNDGNNWRYWSKQQFSTYNGFPSIVNKDVNDGFYLSYGDFGMHSDNPFSPWTLVSFPIGRTTNMISLSDESLLGSVDSSIWRSGGIDWQYDTTLHPGKLVIDSSKNIFCIGPKVYRSSDKGKTWDSISSQLSHWSASVSAAIVHPSGTFFAATDNGTLISTDSGEHWNPYHSANIASLATSRKGFLYEGSVGAIAEVFRTDDIRKSFKVFTIDSIAGTVQSLVTDFYENVFAGCFASSLRVYRSTDQGQTWIEFDRGLICTKINSMIELPDGSIAAATDSGVFILALLGCEWQKYSSGLWTKNVPSIACSKSGQLYVGSDGCGVFKSTKLFNDTLNFTGMIDPGGLVDFKTVQTGSSSCQNITLKNRGLKPFTLKSYTVIDPIPFSVSDESAKKLPVTLNPNDSIVMTICFHPPQPAVYASSIIWNTDIVPALCGISRETELHGTTFPQSSVLTSSQTTLQFSLHPNPVSGNSFTVSFPESQSQPIALSVYDVLGREVYRNNIMPGMKEFDIPIRDLSEGVYYVRVESNGETMTEKFIREK